MRLVVGVIGHVDHGKTALVRALTGMETDRLEEERRRGISIALGFAHLAVPGGTIDFIDMPGHERFVRTMVSGATGMDAALLVVAANEGVMPQTREHLDIAALLGIRKILVAITKIDLEADPGLAAGPAAALARRRGLRVAGTIPVSAHSGAGMKELRDALAAMLPEASATADDGFFHLPIDRAFTMQGHGTVVTGTLRRGRLAVTDEVCLLPGDRPVRLRGLQVHGTRTVCAQPGQRVAANLRDVDAGQLPRGSALAPPGLLAPSLWLSVMLTAVESAAPIANGARLICLAATLETEARLRLLDRDELRGGETALAQLHTAAPVALPSRERFILRRASPPSTVGGGCILDPVAHRLRRRAPGAGAPAGHARLAALAGATPAEIVRGEIERAAEAGVDVLSLGRIAGLSRARIIAEAGPSAVITGGRHAVCGAAFRDVIQTVHRLLADSPEGLARDRLGVLLPKAGEPVIEAAIAKLAADGLVRSSSGSVSLKIAERERSRAVEEAAAACDLAETLRKAGLSPPDPASLLPPPAARRLVELLVRQGLAVRTFDVVQKREVIFHRDAIDDAKRQLAPHLAGEPGLRVGEAGARLGISRKYAVPLLEHLDAIHFTRRLGDRRRLAEPATGLARMR